VQAEERRELIAHLRPVSGGFELLARSDDGTELRLVELDCGLDQSRRSTMCSRSNANSSPVPAKTART
jgi:hypothetical protein